MDRRCPGCADHPAPQEELPRGSGCEEECVGHRELRKRELRSDSNVCRGPEVEGLRDIMGRLWIPLAQIRAFGVFLPSGWRSRGCLAAHRG